MGYPSGRAELAMLDSRDDADPLDTLQPVADAATVRRLCATVLTVHAGPAVKQYLVDLVTATRRHSALSLGASPRATLHLLRAAQAHAALAGRGFVTDAIKSRQSTIGELLTRKEFDPSVAERLAALS